ncbi:MAG TPA: TonB-dependent receptor, partial [Sphingobium sp.]
PLSVAVISQDDLATGARTATSHDISLGTEGLAMTNLGPGRNRQFIRGVADSPFNGQSQSTVAVQVDEARVTFDAPDPDLRLIDIDRVEILKGPQGPLYGSGALGGIYHIVTRRPQFDEASLSFRLSTEGVQHGGFGSGAEAIVNLPILQDRLAFRGVGYRFVNAGWIDNAGGRQDSNSADTVGLRLALQWRPEEDWTIDAGAAIQNINVHDSQYVDPAAKSLTRTSRLREPTDNDFKMAHATVEGDLGELRFISATSYVDNGFDYALDASDAAANFGLSGLVRFADRRSYTLFNQELRLSSEGKGRWIVGASFLRGTTDGLSSVTGQSAVAQTVATLARKATEFAIFGEVAHRLFGKVDATLGARLSDAIFEDETSERARQHALKRSKIIFSPSASLSLPLDGRGILYLRYARAMRPGGLAPAGMTAAGRFDSDELSTVDLGVRHASQDGHLSLSASAYHSQWDEIQSDYLLPDGLISTRNAGQGRIFGMEAALDWQLGQGFSVAAGGAIQNARLTHGQDGVELHDRRLPVTPEFSGRISLAKIFALNRWQGQAAVQANYIGNARLSFDSDLDRKMGDYTILAMHAELSRGPWTIGSRLDNLFDIRGDSFAFGNPFSIRENRQFTPVRPRTVTLSIARGW